MAAIYVAWAPNHAVGSGDTEVLIRSVGPSLACMQAGRFVGCDINSPFPLLQFLPAVALHLLGLGAKEVKGALALLNLVAFFGMFGLGRWLFRTDRRALVLGALLLLSSPFWAYGIWSFGETLAAFLTLLFVVLSAQRKPSWALLLCFVAAGLTKETAAPVLFVLGLAAAPEFGWRSRPAFRARVFLLLAGVALTLLIHSGWNVFRYGVPWNLYYAHQATWNLDLVQNARFFAALWVSPFSGLFVFWPAWTLTTIAIIMLSRTARSGLVALALLLVTLGLSRWWAPFGWECYGQRLMLPWLPACAAVLIYYERAAVERIVHQLTRSRLVFIAAMVGLLLTTLPHLFAWLDWRGLGAATNAHYLAKYPVLRVHFNPDVNPSIYYRNVNLVMWAPDSVLLVLLEEGLRQPKYYPWLLLPLMCLAGLMISLRRASRADLQPPMSVDTGLG